MASASGNKDHRHRGSLRAQKTLDDRISQLPDSLLAQILSLLPTNEAFRTSTLSKRWKYLWTSVHNFNFNFHKGIEKEFESFVDYALAHSVSSKIKKFEVNFIDYYDSRWLSFASERKVEDVVLQAYDYATIPKSFCTCSSLITLDITCCDFDDSKAISWKSLKRVKLEEMLLSDYDIVNLLAGCPELETMELSQVDCFQRMEINSLKLKRLYLKDLRVDDVYDTSMEIFAPYLQHFGISGDLEAIEFRLLDVSSLVSADLRFHNSCPNRTCSPLDDDEEDSQQNYHQQIITLIQDNLQKLSCATELTLGSWFTQVMCMLLLKGMQFPELKCKDLTLKLDKDSNLYGAAGILRASPHVETLNIDMCSRVMWSPCNFVLRYLAEGDNIDLRNWISNFEFPNLKHVKIVNTVRLCARYNSNFQSLIQSFITLSELVLENATVLEKFVISNSIKCHVCPMNCASPFLSYLTKTLLVCPRASTNCAIIYQE